MEISEFGNTSGTGAWHIVKLMLLVLIREVNRLFYPSQYLVHVGYHINMCWFIHATALNRGLAVWASFYHRKKLGHMIEMSQDPGLSILFHLVPIKGFFLLLLIPRVFFGWGGFSLFNMTRHLFFLVIKLLMCIEIKQMRHGFWPLVVPASCMVILMGKSLISKMYKGKHRNNWKLFLVSTARNWF